MKIFQHAFMAFTAALSLSLPSAHASWEKVNTVNTDQPRANQDFGRALALAPDVLIVGSPHEKDGDGKKRGTTYVYARPNGEEIAEAEVLVGLEEGEDWGYAVDVSSDSKRFVVGAPQLGEISRTGLARIYERINGQWSEMKNAQLYGHLAGEHFGKSVAMSSDGLLVCVGSGADAAIGSGRVDVFFWEESGGWQYKRSYEGHSFSFGDAIDIVKNGKKKEYYIAMTSPSYTGSGGAVEIVYFSPETNDSSEVTMIDDVEKVDTVDLYGKSVSFGMHGNTLYLAIGIPSAAFSKGGKGRVETYRLDVSKKSPKFDFIETIDEIEDNDKTGESIALSRDGLRLVVGSPGYDEYTGAVRVFDFHEKKKKYLFVGEEFIIGEGKNRGFGESVAMFGLDLAISSPFNYGDYVELYRYDGETIYESSLKKEVTGFVKFLIVLHIVFALALLVYCGVKKLKKHGYSFNSISKAMETQQSTTVNVANEGGNVSGRSGFSLRPSRGKHTLVSSDEHGSDLELREIA